MATEDLRTEPLHRRLKRLRSARGLTMKALSARVGIPMTTYREWEYGRSIRGEPYEKLARAFGIGLTELMTGSRPSGSEMLAIVRGLEAEISRLRRSIEESLPGARP